MKDIRRIPKLKIKAGKKANTLILTDANNVPHEFSCNFDDTAAGQIRRGLRKTLEQITERLYSGEEPELTIKDASWALSLLDQRGISMMFSIFGRDREEVSQLFQENFPLWSAGSSPVVITAAAELSRFLPLEFLPLFDIRPWPTCPDWSTLALAARRFPGFSAIIRREFYNLKVPQDLTLKGNPKLPLKCFVEQSLPGAMEEVEFFKSNHGIEFDGPWPETKLDQFSDLLAQYLQFANKTFAGDLRKQADQIQHFVCHCQTDESIPTDSTLKLSEENSVTIAELHASMKPPSQLGNQEPGPLIFLNACGTSKMDPMTVASFPQFFLKDNGNRGFIGTETNIPDEFAADFSRSFYESLLNGVRLGEAIYEAKWKMLREQNNPLGILYTLYADPDMFVNKQVVA